MGARASEVPLLRAGYHFARRVAGALNGVGAVTRQKYMDEYACLSSPSDRLGEPPLETAGSAGCVVLPSAPDKMG